MQTLVKESRIVTATVLFVLTEENLFQCKTVLVSICPILLKVFSST